MPSIKEALEFYADPFEWKEKNDPENVVFVPDHYEVSGFGDTAKAALATFQPDGERREAIARIIEDAMRDTWIDIEQLGNRALAFNPDHWSRYTGESAADRILASGLVQNEAGIRADEREKCAKVLDDIETDADGKCRWTDVALATAAIRSARDGGAS